MPAISQVDIEKVYQGEFFTNRYLSDLVPGFPSGDALVAAIVSYEKPIMYDTVTYVRARHSSLTVGDDLYRNYVLTGNGVRTTPVGGLLPLFNVVRIDFNAAAGRPSRKYLRGVLAEGDIVGGDIIPALISGQLQSYITAVVGNANIVDPQGDDLISGVVITQVAMRQLRRGSRRRTEPVL